MKGIILAGGTGSRLFPVTLGVSKQLAPVYDKPMIYYPIATLMSVGITEILVITTPHERPQFERLLGDGAQWGLRLTYASQPHPDGLAQAFVIGSEHVGDDPVALILGDNIFHGPGLEQQLRKHVTPDGGVIFAYHVSNPEAYGVVDFDADGRALSLEEKPDCPRSTYAVPGLYFYDSGVVEIARGLRPSERGELEITDVNAAYLAGGRLRVEVLPRGTAWLDTGTPDALLHAGEYVATLTERQGIRIACLEEIALRMGFIDADRCYRLGERMAKTGYGRYVMEVATGRVHEADVTEAA